MRDIKIGVEIEFFGVNYSKVIEAFKQTDIKVEWCGYTHRHTSYWKLVTDSSVTYSGTGVFNGLELVSPILKGDDGLDELEKVLEVLNSLGAKVDKTCGLHVHHDISDYEVENLISIHNFYYKFQRAIDKFLPKSRRNSSSQYCKRIPASRIKKIQNAVDFHDVFAALDNNRYLTLNAQAYLRHGTIEFRQHSGTTDFEKIESWIIFTHAIVNYCKNNSVDFSSVSTDDVGLLLRTLNLDGSYAGNFLERRVEELA